MENLMNENGEEVVLVEETTPVYENTEIAVAEMASEDNKNSKMAIIAGLAVTTGIGAVYGFKKLKARFEAKQRQKRIDCIVDALTIAGYSEEDIIDFMKELDNKEKIDSNKED